MADDARFVTVLRSSDARLVDLVASALDAEGIAYQHPGKNHAALIPGFTYVEIELRVPESSLDDARAIVGRLQARDPDAPTPVSFRVKRTYAALGGILGAVAGIIEINLAFRHAPELIRTAVLGISICLGYLFGRAISRDSCSLPGCRAKLERDATTCRKCGAELRGEISSARKHFAALEEIKKLPNSEAP